MTHQSATSTGRRRASTARRLTGRANVADAAGAPPLQWSRSCANSARQNELVHTTDDRCTPVHVSQPIHLDPSRRIEDPTVAASRPTLDWHTPYRNYETPTSGRLCCSSHRGGVFWSAFRHLGQRDQLRATQKPLIAK